MAREDREQRIEEIKAKRLEARERYEQFKDSILLTAANIPDVKSIKLGDGLYDTEGYELVDGVSKKVMTLLGSLPSPPMIS